MRFRPVPLVLALTCLALSFSWTGMGASHAAGTDALLEAGRELYLTGCSGCHGGDGAGVRVIDDGAGPGGELVVPASSDRGVLRGPSLLDSGGAAAFYYLSTGRMPLANTGDQPRRKAPAYTPAEIDALVAYVASLGDGPGVPAIDITDADLAEGGVIFRGQCQACHSAFGSGGALSYGRAAPALHSVEPTEVGAAVRAGPGQMPVFGPDVISDEELDDLAAYVEFLKDPENYGGVQIGRNGPVPEGFVAWLFGIGGLMLVVVWIGGRSPVRSTTEEHHG